MNRCQNLIPQSPEGQTALLNAALLGLLTAPAVDRCQAEPQPERLWAPAQARREQILEAALNLFRTHGFHGVGIDEIGAAIGVTGPAIYAYFDSNTASSSRPTIAPSPASRSVQTPHSQRPRRLAMGSLDWLAAMRRSPSTREIYLQSPAARTTRCPPGTIPILPTSSTDPWWMVMRELRPELTEPELNALVGAVFPLMNEIANVVAIAGFRSTRSSTWCRTSWRASIRRRSTTSHDHPRDACSDVALMARRQPVGERVPSRAQRFLAGPARVPIAGSR